MRVIDASRVVSCCRRLFLLLAVALVSMQAIRAVGAPYGPNGKAADYRQSDGSTVKVRVFGDEFHAVAETEEGYTVVYDENKVLRFGKLSADGKDIVSSDIRANNKPAPAKLLAAGMKPHIRLNPQGRKMAVAKGLQRMRADKKGRITPESVQYYAAALANAHAQSGPASVRPQSDSGSEVFVASPPSFAPPSETRRGEYIGICILVDFPDQAGTIARSEVDDYCNKPGYTGFSNACSIYDYFYKQSNGRLRYNNTVTAYVRVPNPKTYYDDGVDGTWGDSRAQDLVSDALDVLMAQGFDFTQFSRDGSDVIYSVNIFYAGTVASGWSTGLWPHKWAIPTKTVDAANGIKVSTYQMSDMGTQLEMGTFCHENGHMLMGYPDLYSYDGNANNMGNYTLMAGGSHTGGGKHPCNVDPYLKTGSGWSEIIELDSSSHQRCSVQVDANLFYRYLNPTNPQEYFIFEVRDNTGYEGPYGGTATTVSPADGLVVYHVLEDGSSTHSTIFTANNPTNDYSTPYETMIVEANPPTTPTPWYDDPSPGTSDAFKSSDKDQISDVTTPALKFWDATGRNTASGCEIHSISADGPTMTFVVGAGAPSGSPAIVLSRTTIDTACDLGGTAPSETFAIANGGGGTLSYTSTTNQSWLSCSPASGTAIAESDTIAVDFATSGLAAGSYVATISITDSAATNSPQTVTVSLTVNAQPVMLLSVTNIAETAISGSAGPSVGVDINNTGGGVLNYSAAKTQSWLTLSPASGTVLAETDTIYVDLDATSLTTGTYYDTITITSAEASDSPQTVTVEFTVLDGPVATVTPSNIWVYGVTGSIDSASVMLTNSGGSDLSFTISDDFPPPPAYSALDSDAPSGPTYSWIDISALGASVELADDGASSMLSIGFDFQFSGATYSQFMIGANGAISLTSGAVDYINAALPAAGLPSQAMAVLWDDLDPSTGGEIRYHSTAERLVVSWLAVPRYGTTEYETFQVVLYPDGRVLYQYKTLNGTLTSCTVGLQDDSKSGPATQVAYNTAYLKNSLAIEFMPSEIPWLSYPVSSGAVPQDSSTSVWFYASASNLTDGVYTALVSIAMNDISNRQVDIPLVFTVSNVPPAIVAPSNLSATAVATNQIDLAWSDNSTNETGFAIERSATSGSGFALIASAAANATAYSDIGLPMGATRYYRVSATNSTDSSTITPEAFATTPKIPATVSLSNLSQTYNGAARSVTVATTPAGLTVDMTYASNPFAPTNAGTYAVVATVNEPSYEGGTNGTLVVSQVIPTVDSWPTAASIQEGQDLSSASLSGGSAAVPGSFNYDAPAMVPGLGVYTAAVTFVATDSVNYETVAGTVDVTVTEAPPATPTDLAATALVGQVDLSWTAAVGAASYKVKRSSVSSGPYTTVGSPTVTAYSDTTASDGSTYYYVVSAINSGGESTHSTEASVVLLHLLPFTEDFEGLTLGGLSGQNLWDASNAVVQTTVALGSQGCSITSEEGYVEHRFAGSETSVWMDFELKPILFDAHPSSLDPDGTAIFYFNTNGNPVVYDGTNILTLTDVAITTGDWVRLTVRSDYATKTWDLYINTLPVASDLGFYKAAAEFFVGFKVQGGGGTNVALDNLVIALVSPLSADADSDGMPDTWETNHGLSTTTNNATSDYDGDGVPDYNEYVAGTDPNDGTKFLRITSASINGSGHRIVTWNSEQDNTTPVRNYIFQRCISLMHGSWSNVSTNIPPSGATTEGTDSGVISPPVFYRVVVPLPE